jgi:hypothetical protein
MRHIEEQMLAAIRDRRNWHASNTAVQFEAGVTTVMLHGNIIARIHGPRLAEQLEFTLAGWNTATTRSRLNAILGELSPGAVVFQRRWMPRFSRGRNIPDRTIHTHEWVNLGSTL